MASRDHSFTGQSAINQDAADGGYWHQRVLIDALSRWRSDRLGARLALGLFGPQALRASALGAAPMDDPGAKPDLMAWMILPDGSRQERLVSAKLSRIGSTDSSARPMHHAARVKFEDAPAHGLLPVDDVALRGALLSHFIDGEPLSRQDTALRESALAFLSASWPLVARCAMEGLGEPRACSVAISMARAVSDGLLELASTRVLRVDDAIALLISEPPKLSEPRDGQVGTIGSRLIHIQRGQALSLGAQRDIQIKINAGALFESARELPEIV